MINENKILFVDDEINMLKSIRRNFSGAGLTIFTAETPYDGLHILENNQIDIVVSDFQMANIDGGDFLNIVKERFPHINRMILSGHTEKETVFNSIFNSSASNYLTKPMDSDVLLDSVNYLMKCRKLLNNDKFRKFINNMDKLPFLPEIVNEFTEALNNNSPLDEITNIIKKDISLSIKVLQLVNSTCYSSEKTYSIRKAIKTIGYDNLKKLFLNSSFLRFENINKYQLEHFKLLHNEITSINAVFTKLYELKYKEIIPENYINLGIYAEIGKIVLLMYFPERYDKIIREVEKDITMDFYNAELLLGYEEDSHPNIGAYLLALWNLPAEAKKAALLHNKIDLAPDDMKPLFALLKTAKLLYSKLNDSQLEEFLLLDIDGSIKMLKENSSIVDLSDLT